MKPKMRPNFVAYVAVVILFLGVIAPFTFLKVDHRKITPSKHLPETPPKVIEKPLHSIDLPDFAAIKDIKTKKRTFFNFLKPTIVQENKKLMHYREQIKTWLVKVSLEEPLTQDEELQLNELVKKYKVNKKYSLLQKLDALLLKVDVIPTALVLVQAANESAWGTSRFSRIGLNFFGIWCFRPGCGMVPNGRNIGAKHEVAAFQSVEEAISRYLFNINTNSAYNVFRTIRAQLRAQNEPLHPQILATGLLPYSERGTDYVLEITDMIRHNREFIF